MAEKGIIKRTCDIIFRHPEKHPPAKGKIGPSSHRIAAFCHTSLFFSRLWQCLPKSATIRRVSCLKLFLTLLKISTLNIGIRKKCDF